MYLCACSSAESIARCFAVGKRRRVKCRRTPGRGQKIIIIIIHNNHIIRRTDVSSDSTHISGRSAATGRPSEDFGPTREFRCFPKVYTRSFGMRTEYYKSSRNTLRPERRVRSSNLAIIFLALVRYVKFIPDAGPLSSFFHNFSARRRSSVYLRIALSSIDVIIFF